VYINSLFTPPNRLVGMQPLTNQRAKGKHGLDSVEDLLFDGKILYQRCKSSVFPPSEFDPEVIERSNKVNVPSTFP
jgi:uncharacterized OB-fold protein